MNPPAPTETASPAPSAPTGLASGQSNAGGPTDAPSPLTAWVMRLREGVKFLRRPGSTTAAPSEFVIEDTTRDKYYRIGEREYTLLTRLDGQSSLAAIIGQIKQNDPHCSLTDEQVLEIGRWLLTTGLGHLTSHPTHGEVEREQAHQLRTRLGWLNPVSLKFKLGNPDRVLDTLLPFCRWMVGPVGAVLGAMVAFYGGMVLITEWDRFAADMQGILGPDRWWLLLVVWLGLKGFHELAHGLTCKKYGGHVREWGLLFILFAPMGAWVNVTSSWKFPSRWQRIHVAAAGMLCEIVLAGMAAIAWERCEPGMLRYALQNVVISASVVTILFNLNPLMRFDGYFILSEWLRIPNLAGRGQQAVTRQWQQVLFGIPQATGSQRSAERLIVPVYGWAALYWRLLTGVGILIACSTLLHGFGLVLAFACGVMTYAWPMLRTVRQLGAGLRVGKASLWRMSTGLLVAGGVLYALFTVVPWPGHVIGHGVIDYAQRSPVRAEASGFVRQVEIEAGDTVTSGQPLFSLENPELQAEASILLAQLNEARDRASYFLAEGSITAWKTEAERITALTARAEDVQRRIEGLRILASGNGRVLGHDLQMLQGQWVERGTLLCEIGQDASKELIFALAQQDIEVQVQDNAETAPAYSPSLENQAARIIPAGDTPLSWPITLRDVLPTAEWSPPHPALSAHLGGPLAVQMISERQSQSPHWQLVSPQIVGRVPLDPQQSLALRSGERVTIQLDRPKTPFGMHLLRVTTEWFEERVKAAWRLSTYSRPVRKSAEHSVCQAYNEE